MDLISIPWRDHQSRLSALIDEAKAWRNLAKTLQQDMADMQERGRQACDNARRTGLQHFYTEGLTRLLDELAILAHPAMPSDTRIALEDEHLRRTMKPNERNKAHMTALRNLRRNGAESQPHQTPFERGKIAEVMQRGLHRTPEEQAEDDALVEHLRKVHSRDGTLAAQIPEEDQNAPLISK